jgi:hypothetical protein
MSASSKTVKGAITVERENNMTRICKIIVEVLKIKNPKYGDSWKAKGGYSAFFNLDRKWSRVEHLASQHGYDIFAAMRATHGQPDGMEEALRDLLGYGVLTLDELFQAEGDKLHPKRDQEL